MPPSQQDTETDASATRTLPTDRDHSGRSFGEEELAHLRDVLEDGSLFAPRGTKVPKLEEALAVTFGVASARAVSSGTAAVHTALAAVEVGPGDEVVTSPITDMGALSPILFQGAVPVFADVDPETLNVTAETLRPRITERTAAIVVTHLFGNPCEMDPILELAGEREIPVIEDAAQAFLARYRGRTVGTLGDAAAFSLQQGKHMTCGEGGFVLTDDPEVARRARLFADKGWAYGAEEPDHEFLGLNYRITELQGAVALAQLGKLEEMVDRRVETAERLRDRVREMPGIRPIPTTPDSRATYWRLGFHLDTEVLGVGPDELGARLTDLGVHNAPKYIRKPTFLCRQFAERRTFGDSRFPYSVHPSPPEPERLEDYPGCRDGLARLLVIPWTERHGPEDVDFVADRIRRAADEVGNTVTTGTGGAA